MLKNAIEAFKTVSPKLFGEDDTDCNRYAAAGADIIKAACVARAGYEDSFDITKEITTSLESFTRVTEIESVTDIVKIKKRRPERINPEGIAYVFHNYEKWPCWYHLDILAHTNGWHSRENTAMLGERYGLKLYTCLLCGYWAFGGLLRRIERGYEVGSGGQRRALCISGFGGIYVPLWFISPCAIVEKRG